MKDSLKKLFDEKLVTPDEAVQCIRSGQTVYIGTCTSTCYELARALGRRSDELENVTVGCSNLFKPLDIMTDPDRFRIISYFMGPTERQAQKAGSLDYTSIHLSLVDIFCRETCPPDVAFLEVSLPDEDGYMSFGATGVALNKFIQEQAKTVILQINKYAPYVYGEDNLINIRDCDMAVRFDEEIAEVPNMEPTPEVKAISEYVIDQIPDGACVQLGIGGIGNAVGFGLRDRNDLGIHTELMTDSLAFLMKNGNVTNKGKRVLPGKSVAAFTLGEKALYEFVDHNKDMYYMPFTIANDPRIIARNDRAVSVNSAICIDLMGQVAADNIAGRQFSGTGGQLDFVRGAQMSRGGKSFIAATSENISKHTGKVSSRIVASLPTGAAVTTPRSDVQYVVTEYGCVNLKPLTIKERAHALISIAHPDFRDELTEAARAAGLY